MARAANDASRGLQHLLRANRPPSADLPAPPEGADEPPPPPPHTRKSRSKETPPPPPPGSFDDAEPWRGALEVMRRTKERFDEAGEGSGETGQAFLEAAHHVYARARTAYMDGDYAKAAELARGAEAWTHVDEHLQRAGYGGASLISEWKSNAPPPPEDSPRERRRQLNEDEPAGCRAPPPPPEE